MRTEQYYQRKDARQCTKCGYTDERTLSGFTNCDFCAAKARYFAQRANARNTAIYHERKNSGLCVTCGAPRDNGTVRCDVCNAKVKLANKRYLQKKREKKKEARDQ